MSTTPRIGPDLGRRWTDTFSPIAQTDWTLLGAALALTAIGFVMIGGATANNPSVIAGEGNIYIERQMIAATLGIATAVVVTMFDYRSFRGWAIVVYIGALVLLALVAVPGIGREINGARSWFRFGPLQLQPSELAKIAIILVLAAHFHEYQSDRLGLRALLEALGFSLLPMGLIMLQPDFGTFLVFAVIVAGMMWMAGVRVEYMLTLVALALTGAWSAMRLGVLKEYQRNRLLAFIDPENIDPLNAGYNVVQAQIAVGAGRFFGQGIGNGSQTRSGFVPENETDFIFTVVGEQTGFVGSVVVVLLFGVVIWRGLQIARSSRDQFGTLIATGVVSMLMFQMFINIGMAVGIMPVTGLPLPFISYGGTSLITTWVLIGLLQNVHMRRYIA